MTTNYICHIPGSNSTTTLGPRVTTTDVVAWAVFSVSTFLACIVTAVTVVAVVASQKRRNKKPVTGVLVLFLNFRLKPKSEHFSPLLRRIPIGKYLTQREYLFWTFPIL